MSDILPPSDLSVWNVKGFPTVIRTRITNAAASQGVTVAEWLTAYFQKHGIEGEALPVIQPKSNPANHNGSTADVAQSMHALAAVMNAAAAMATATRLPKAARQIITAYAQAIPVPRLPAPAANGAGEG